ncbi:MAG: hypothetical protein PHQ42_03730 [Patescibacteria group bacterium]|nr:hypothetical protein [Patescibacteria group bacterium]
MVDDKNLQLENPENKNLTPEKVEGEIKKIESVLLGGKEMTPERRETLTEKEGKGTEEKPKTIPFAAGLSDIGEAETRRKEREEKIGKILETGMEEVYLSLPADKQREFKARGEATTREINKLLGKVKVKAEKIVYLIKKWLSIIPGVNKFFLEQEAKIKTDEIMKLKER